jgi:hypothetical protein
MNMNFRHIQKATIPLSKPQTCFFNPHPQHANWTEDNLFVKQIIGDDWGTNAKTVRLPSLQKLTMISFFNRIVGVILTSTQSFLFIQHYKTWW